MSGIPLCCVNVISLMAGKWLLMAALEKYSAIYSFYTYLLSEYRTRVCVHICWLAECIQIQKCIHYSKRNISLYYTLTLWGIMVTIWWRATRLFINTQRTYRVSSREHIATCNARVHLIAAAETKKKNRIFWASRSSIHTNINRHIG